ncbi:MAG: DUF6516 family protein [Bacillota bacterium]|nr:DUF6516 family protein [Bacillota bacterium]
MDEIAAICAREFPRLVVAAYIIDPRRGRIRLDLRDGTYLDIHQGARGGYSYHWQRATDSVRFNNAPHFDHIESAPHHLHVGDEVRASDVRGVTEEDVRKVLRFIDSLL